MRFFAVLAALSLAIPAFAAPAQTLHTIQKYQGEVTGKYIVNLKGDVSLDEFLAKLNSKTLSHVWDRLNGFAGHLDTEALNLILTSPEVAHIEEDGIVHIQTTQNNATWGLSRLSSKTKLANQDPSALTFSYSFDAKAGGGVDIYVVDTGVRTTHTQFGGRAKWGATFGPYADVDGNGHGTHVAGTASGSQFGVSKLVNIIAVKVLSDQGSGSFSDIISGLNFVGNSATASHRPSIVSMSLGGSPSLSVDKAVTSLTNSGVHVVVAAGNSNEDAGGTSPARAPGALTVGASTIADARASFSNFGSVVAVFAPGLNVISAWIGSDTDTRSISGTSMATPHVSGLVAYLIALQGNVSPAAMKAKVQRLALKGILSGIPAGTVNYLAHNA